MKKTKKVVVFETVAIPTHVDAATVAIAAISRVTNYPGGDFNRSHVLQAVCAFFGYDAVKRAPQTSKLAVE